MADYLLDPRPLLQYVPPPKNPLLPSDEEILRDHVVRIQGMFLDIVDKQIATVHDKLEEKELELKVAENASKEVTFTLGKAWSELEKTELCKSQENGTVLAVERDAASREAMLIQLDNEKLRSNLESVCAQMQETMNKLTNLNEINAAYRSDMTVAKRVQHKLEKERETIEGRHKEIESELLMIRKKAERAIEQKRLADEALLLQQNEMRVAQNAINRMSHEMNRSSEVKKALEKQWENSLAAMTRRDASLQATEKAREEAHEEAVQSNLVARSLKQDNETLITKNKEINTALERLREQNNSLAAELAEERRKHDDDLSKLAEAQVGQSLYQQELGKVSKTKETLAEQLDEKSVAISELRNQLKHLKSDYDRTTHDEAVHNVIRVQERRTEDAVADLRQTMSVQENANMHLRHNKTDLQLRVQTLEEELNTAKKGLGVLKSKYDTINSHYERLYEESQTLLYKLERRDMDYNAAVLRLEQQAADPRPLEIVVQNMQKEIDVIKREKDHLERGWLASQQECLELKSKQSRLLQDNDMMQTQLRIRDATKTKSSVETDAMKKEVFDKSMEITQLYVELQKLRPQMKELQAQNIKLEADLINSTAHVQETRVTSETSVNMLKQDLRRVYNDKSILSQSRIVDVNALKGLEQKYIMAKEILDRTKREKQELIKQNWDLKVKVDTWSKRVTEMKAQWQRLGDVSQFHVTKRLADIEKHATQVAKEHKRQGGRHSDEAMPPTDPYEIVDVPSLKLRLQSLINEKRYVMSESDMRKDQNQKLSKRLQYVEHELEESTTKLKTAERDARNTQLQLHSTSVKCTRAQQIAAVLERQLKEAKPNARIEYFWSASASVSRYNAIGDGTDIMGIEPSTMLLAALMGTVDENSMVITTATQGGNHTEFPILNAKGKRVVSTERIV